MYIRNIFSNKVLILYLFAYIVYIVTFNVHYIFRECKIIIKTLGLCIQIKL